MIPFKHYGENCPLSHSFQNQEKTNVHGCKIMPNCRLQKPNYPSRANSTDVKELPRTRQNYFWIAEGAIKADARPWTAVAEKEWAQWCDTMWICYIWKQWLWLKIDSKKYQGPLVPIEISLFTPRSQISCKLFMWLNLN